MIKMNNWKLTPASLLGLGLFSGENSLLNFPGSILNREGVIIFFLKGTRKFFPTDGILNVQGITSGAGSPEKSGTFIFLPIFNRGIWGPFFLVNFSPPGKKKRRRRKNEGMGRSWMKMMERMNEKEVNQEGSI